MIERPSTIEEIFGTRTDGKQADVDARVTAVAVVAEEATERSVRELVESLRARGVAAAVYDVGPGVVMMSDVRLHEIDELIGSHRAIERFFVADTRYRLARREVRPLGSITRIGGVPFGGERFPIIAGPCAVESRESLIRIASACRERGASVLRGGAYKPRTSPYDFQGLGQHGVEMLAEAREATGMPIVTEVMDTSQIEAMYPLVDAFQVGARNMQNFDLLRALSDIDRPVLLKRGLAATMEEWLLAAEYIMSGGNDQIVLCERGIRTYNSDTRFTLDLATVALAKRETHLPVIVDPSHATGNPKLVIPMACAALAAGADGVMVEVHDDIESSLSDADQALSVEAFERLVERLIPIGVAVGRHVIEGPVRVDGAG